MSQPCRITLPEQRSALEQASASFENLFLLSRCFDLTRVGRDILGVRAGHWAIELDTLEGTRSVSEFDEGDRL